MDYMNIMLHDLLNAGKSNNYDGVQDALYYADCLIKQSNLINYKSIQNNKTIELINILFKNNKNEINKYLMFINLMRIFLAKYLFIYDLQANMESFENFKNDFIMGIGR